MHRVSKGYRGLVVFLIMNSDRIFSFGTVILGLLAGAFLGTAILHR